MPEFMYDAAFSPKGVNWPAHGAIALAHYLSGPYATTSPDPTATLKLGLGVKLNWERQPGALVGATRAAGQSFARDALSAVPAGCPHDGSVSIAFSVDQYVSDPAACDAAFHGLNDVLRPAGLLVQCYAEGAVLDHLAAAGLVQGKQWLSMSESFPGFNARDPRVGCVQMHDGLGNWIGTDVQGTDRNTITDPQNFGIWWPKGSKYLPTVQITSPSKGSPDMAAAWLVEVSKSDCAARNVQWPGVFLTDGIQVKHVAHPSDQATFQKRLGAPDEISLDQYYNLGGK